MTARSDSLKWLDLARALLADPGHGGGDGFDLLGHDLDDHPPAIGGVGYAADISGPLEPIDHAGDRARRQPHDVGQLAGRRGAVSMSSSSASTSDSERPKRIATVWPKNEPW